MTIEKISITGILDGLEFLPDRTPTSSEAETAKAFATLSDYRDGGIFVGHYAGNSAWERHIEDEIVMVEGETTLFLNTDDGIESHSLGHLGMVVVPRDTWHRFETPAGVKIMTVTPQPTDHTLELP